MPIHSPEITGGGELRFGPEGSRFSDRRLSEVNILQQYRRKYENEAHETLVESIRRNGMTNPILIAEMRPEEVLEYLRATNRAWGSELTIADLNPTPDATYCVVVAGHRRLLAIQDLASQYVVAPENVRVSTFLAPNNDVLNVMRQQGAENTYHAPNPQDQARLIHQMYLYGMDASIYQSVQDFVDDSPFSEHQTRDALKYVVMPDEIQSYVENGVLAYTSAVNLYPLYEAAYEYHVFHNAPASCISELTDGTFISDVRQFLSRVSRPTGAIIKDFVRNRRQELLSRQEQLFLLSEEPLEVRSNLALHSIAASAENINALVTVIDNNGGIDKWLSKAAPAAKQNAAAILTHGLAALQRIHGQSVSDDDPIVKSLKEYNEAVSALFEDLKID